MTKKKGLIRVKTAALLALATLSMAPVRPGAFARTPSTDSATAPAAFECEGDACPHVTLTWEEEGQRFRVTNNSDSGVKVEVTTYAGDSGVRVEPHKSGYLEVKYFNGPYRADFE